MPRQLWAKAITVETGTSADATVSASASCADLQMDGAGRQRCKAIYSIKAHVGADAVSP